MRTTANEFAAIAGLDHAALACLDIAALSVSELAEVLRGHGAAHLSPIERIELAERLTRRRFISGAGALGLGLITGCGPGEQGAAPTATVGATRTLTDARGETVTLPVRPQRIVSIWGYGAPALLEAGGPLVGGNLAVEPLLEQDLRATYDLAGVREIGAEGGQPNVELIATLRPDLILTAVQAGTLIHADSLPQLQAIAPVFAVDVFQSVESLSATIAELVGGEAQATIAAARNEFNQALDALKPLLAADGLSVSFALYFAPDGVYTYGPTQLPAVDVLTRAGAQWLPIVDEAVANGGDLQLSLEQVDALSADLVVAYNLGGANFAAIPVVAALPAARSGQLITLPETHQAITWRNYTAIARQYIELLTPLAPLDPAVIGAACRLNRG